MFDKESCTADVAEAAEMRFVNHLPALSIFYSEILNNRVSRDANPTHTQNGFYIKILLFQTYAPEETSQGKLLWLVSSYILFLQHAPGALPLAFNGLSYKSLRRQICLNAQPRGRTGSCENSLRVSKEGLGNQSLDLLSVGGYYAKYINAEEG